MANDKSPAEHDLVKRLYIAGATVRQIRAITGFASNTCHRHILMIRDYVKCKHEEKLYLCKLCHKNNGHNRKPLADLRKEVGINAV